MDGLAHQLFDPFPRIREKLPVERLGDLPTPVSHLGALEATLGAGEGTLYAKRDDLTSPLYGGNKVRTLEVLFGRARALGATRIFSTGAFGSNHALATVLHAPRAGLDPGALLYPQPVSEAALENLRVTLAESVRFVALPHWSAFPFGLAWLRRDERRRGHRTFVMVPGGATPEGALGYAGAAFELSQQVERGELPRPDRIVLAVGSTCTTAGLLVGFELAARLGIGFVERGRPSPPEVVAVRVTPWPVTSPIRILGLAVRTSRLLAELAGDPSLAVSRAAFARRLRVDTRYIGRGYGHATRGGVAAIRLFAEHGGPVLDTTYSGKSAAAFVDLVRSRVRGTTLYWATKSGAPLPPARSVPDAPPSVTRWIERAERRLHGQRA